MLLPRKRRTRQIEIMICGDRHDFLVEIIDALAMPKSDFIFIFRLEKVLLAFSRHAPKWYSSKITQSQLVPWTHSFLVFIPPVDLFLPRKIPKRHPKQTNRFVFIGVLKSKPLLAI